MTTTGSSIISSLGAGSGVDFGRLASDLSAATFAAQRQNVSTTTAALEARISAASGLRSMVTSLASALGDRLRGGDLAPRAILSNPAVANVGFTPGVAPRGNYTLEVTQLAASQRLVLPPIASATDPVGEGELTIRLGTVDGTNFTEDTARPAITITIVAGESLSDLARRINGATDRAVNAQVLNGTNGAQLVLTGRDGAANGFTIGTTGTGALAGLGWTPASTGGELRASARDALFALNTVEMRSSSNTVSGLPEGMTLQLAATNAGTPASITFANDTSAITRVMGDLVSALNEVVGTANQVGNPLGGELGNDPGLRQLRRELSQLGGQVIMPGAAANEPRTLADLGLKLRRDGTFQFDSARLNQALGQTPDAVAAMFTTGAFGVFAAVDRLARNTTRVGDPGTLGGSLTRYQRQLQGNNARLEKIAEEQERLRERLSRSFTASERRVSASQSTLTFLQQQVDLWTAQRR
jgi:flagellar hook-associated protein 2